MAVPASIAASFSTKEPVSVEDQAAAALSRQLRVSTVEGSDVIKVSFKGEDRRFTEAVLASLLKEYLERYLDLRATPEAADPQAGPRPAAGGRCAGIVRFPEPHQRAWSTARALSQCGAD